MKCRLHLKILTPKTTERKHISTLNKRLDNLDSVIDRQEQYSR